MTTTLFTIIFLLSSPNVVVHFFYSPDCGHCMDILNDDIPRLQERYRFEIKKYDLDILENYRLLEKMEENVAEKGEDLPVIFIGDSVFYGPDEGREKLAGTIKSLVKTAGPLPRDTIKSPFNTVKKEVGKIHLYYFYQTGCKECNRIEILITALTRNYKNLKTHSFNIFDNKSKIFFESLGQKNNIPQAQRLIVPTVIIGKDYLIKEEITLKNVEALLKKYKKGSLKFEFTYSEGAEQSIADRFRHFSIFGIIFAGLLDGVNPCAFATLIFFVSYLLFIGRRRRDIVLMAIFFICAVFITYFAIGIGAFNLLKYITGIQIIAKIIFLAFGVIAIVLGILSMRDFALARQGKTNQMLLQLPLGIKQRIHKDIKEKTAMGSIIFGSLIAGFLISLLEFGCTGQIYLPTITFMVSKAGFALKPLLTLLLYNVMFVLPLIIIALLATLLSTKNIARILETKIPTIKLLTALLFFALGILLILIA